MSSGLARRLSVVAVAGLLLSACADTGSGVRFAGAEPVAVTFHVGDPFPETSVDLPDVAPLDWQACSDHPAPWQCATLSVPIDYHRVDVGRLPIALTRRPAGDPSTRIGSLVVNPGGPGGSGIDLAHSIDAVLPDVVRQRFDLVGFDPRGVGLSDPLQCDLSVDTGFDPSALKACAKANKELIPQLGTVNGARDLEQIRKAVGDRRLTFLGFSYGTALGSVYATLFADKVRAIVLDGSVNPNAGTANTKKGADAPDFYGIQDFQRSRRRFVDECAIASTCPLGRHPATQVRTLEANLFSDEVPATLLAGHQSLTTEILDRDFFAAYYNSDFWPYLAEGVAEANQGDGSVLVALSKTLHHGQTEAEAAQETLANFAVTCADFADRKGQCAGWPATAEPLPTLAKVERQAPILVLGTDGDPATPVEQAAAMADGVGNAVTIYWAGDGHTAFLRGSRCVDDAVSAYLTDVTVPEDTVRCPESDTATTGRASAAQLFAMASDRRQAAFVRRLVEQGDTAQHAACLAAWFAEALDQSQLTHVFLDIPDLSVGLALRLKPSTCITP